MGRQRASVANEEHLSVLLQGRQQWNDWRDANPEVKPDLRNADLHEADLSGVNLSHAVLIDADLHEAILQGANLAGANLRRADLRATNFRNADLHRAILAKTDLRNANLKEADIREADMRGARLPGADFGGADLKGAVLNKDGFRYVSTYNDQLQTTAAGSSSPAANKALEPAAAKGPRLKLALAAGGLLLAVGIVGLSVSRPTREVDARITAAVAEAVGASGGVFVVEVEGQALILRSGSKKVESGRYLGLLKTACQALDKMGPESGLREIRITNQSGEEGWVYEAPEQCGEILTKPPALTSLSIAAHTKPIRKR
jgi:Pentapeptide repeats (8 copies)